MKQITILLIVLIASIFSAKAQVDSSTVLQSGDQPTIEYTDTPSADYSPEKYNNSKSDFNWPDFGENTAMLIPIIAIICVFGLPAVIVFLAFYFKYKNRKAKYKLAEQALAAGQPIPADFFKNQTEKSMLNKGINNAFTGLGLFIFFWASTGEFGIGCIGLFILFTGLGQIVIHYTQENKKNNRNNGSAGE